MGTELSRLTWQVKLDPEADVVLAPSTIGLKCCERALDRSVANAPCICLYRCAIVFGCESSWSNSSYWGDYLPMRGTCRAAYSLETSAPKTSSQYMYVCSVVGSHYHVM